MSDSEKEATFSQRESKRSKDSQGNVDVQPRKGPMSFLSGAITSGLLAWLCLGLSQAIVRYFTVHAPHYSSDVAQSVATSFKTLVIGISFLATFSFGFIGLGLTLVFIRSLFDARPVDAD